MTTVEEVRKGGSEDGMGWDGMGWDERLGARNMRCVEG